MNKLINFPGQTVIKIAYTSTIKKTRTTADKQVWKFRLHFLKNVNFQLVDDDKEALHLHCVQLRKENFEDALNFLAEVGFKYFHKARNFHEWKDKFSFLRSYNPINLGW